MQPRALALGFMEVGANPEEWLAGGPFCFAGQEDLFPDWEKLFHFAPEPLADPQVLSRAAKIAQTLCLAVIPELAEILSPGNQVLSELYWEELLCPWTIDVARQMVERTLRCEAMVREWGSLSLTVPLLPEDCPFTFADEHDFTLWGNLGIKFNHWLFSRILENIWPSRWQKKYLPASEIVQEKSSGEGGKVRYLKDKARDLLLNLPFPRLKGMSLLQAMSFSKAIRHPLHGNGNIRKLKAEYFDPDLLKAIRLPENYTGIFAKCLPLSIRSLKHDKIRIRKVKEAHLRLASPVAYENARYRQSLALWREKGNCIAWGQHGGNYGMVRVACEAEIVEYSQNFYFTWGWDKYEDVKGEFLPMPWPQLAKVENSWKGKEDRIIFTGAEMAAYAYRLDSHPTPLQYVEYRQWKADFLNSLPMELRARVWYRPYFPVPGTLADAKWLMPQFPEIHPCTGELLPQLQDCRLLVLDHHGTTLLEAMAANVPMILYWNSKHWQLCDACEKLLDMLADCGIWHPDPYSAAKKLQEVWPDTGQWWRSSPVVNARKKFCELYARLPEGNLNETWIKVLSDL